jgi:hypothetical protein
MQAPPLHSTPPNDGQMLWLCCASVAYTSASERRASAREGGVGGGRGSIVWWGEAGHDGGLKRVKIEETGRAGIISSEGGGGGGGGGGGVTEATWIFETGFFQSLFEK